jgi:hypothetical protein
MAKITFGQGIADARGAVGGQVFSRNKGGAYLRARVAPINRNTPAQTLVRANFGVNSKAWSTLLTAAERTAWTNFAAANPRVNILGASIILSGLAMYQSLNQVLAQIGSAAISDPPPDLSVPALSPVTGVEASTGIGGVSFESAVPTGNAAMYYVFATAPLNPGKTPQASDFRYLATKAETPAAPFKVDMTAAYAALFGAFLTGASIGMLIATVNPASGAVTPGLRYNLIAS